MNQTELYIKLTSALSNDARLFGIWLDGKAEDEPLGISGAASFDVVTRFIEEVVGEVAQPVVFRDSVFSRGLVVPLCQALQEVVRVTDSLGLEEVRKSDLLRGLVETREGEVL